MDATEGTAEVPLVRLQGVTRRFTRPMTAVESVLSKLGFDYRDEVVQAVSDVSLGIRRGSVMGLVGESGCGKSTLGRIAAGLLPASEGRVDYAGSRIDLGRSRVPDRDMLRIQMIFQNPMASLNPRQRVIDIVTEGPLHHGLLAPRDREAFAGALLEEVGLSADALRRLPHQFSGGQRQRIGIARALSVSPEFLICDEPVAALDVSIQAQIINLLLDLRATRNLTVLFISHDLGVVRHICDRVAVMYLGRIVEIADADRLFADPRHPYTQALLKEIPSVRSGRRAFEPVSGEIPSPLAPPPGCHFHPRCPHATGRCSAEAPPDVAVGPRHRAKCWLSAADVDAPGGAGH